MRVLFKHEEIVEKAKEIGNKLTEKFKGKTPLVLCVLKGACPFHSEMMKHMNMEMEVDYIHVSSYMGGTESTGVVRIKKDIEQDIKGRDVIIVEDIVDTGRTLSLLKPLLIDRKPNSITFVTMLDKPSRRVVDFQPDYVGFTIDDLFVIGFGLDYDEKYRNLKDIYIYNED